YMGIPKGDKFEFLCQKLTELGVRRLVPVRMERSVAKIEEKEKDKKLARFRKIAQEAQKQCGRGMEMEVSDPISVKELEKRVSGHELTLLLWEEAEGYRTKDAYRNIRMSLTSPVLSARKAAFPKRKPVLLWKRAQSALRLVRESCARKPRRSQRQA
ncbi:MAG: RNA methyltransferase, partial [Clostridia bacterium]|nr:RNA methyltransferase [Clostridia bacterium]